MYLAPGASHGPHHIFPEWADKYKGKFDMGWDVLRERVFARQKAMGWIPADTKLTPRPDTLASWDSIPQSERPFQERLMEVFSGFTEHADFEAGRVIDELDKMGLRDNTLIFYMFGDNGSSAEGQVGSISELLAQNRIPNTVAQQMEAMNKLGGIKVLGSPKMDNMYHAGWAWAGSTPFQATKLVASYFGGTRNPMVISWPAKIAPDKRPRSQFHHVNDIAPTIYELLGITPPQGGGWSAAGSDRRLEPGIHLRRPVCKRSQARAVLREQRQPRSVQGWLDRLGLRPLHPVAGVTAVNAKWDPDKDVWSLYDLSKDFSQSTDVAAANRTGWRR